MEKKLVLINEKTGEYFTNDRDNWWNRNITEAAFFRNQEELDLLLPVLEKYWETPFKNVFFMAVVTVYCINE